LKASLPFLEREAPALAAAPFCIGQIAIACALDYMDYRFPDLHWRVGHDRLAGWFSTVAERKAFKATDPRLSAPAVAAKVGVKA
jgi:glutathione S-transferase